MDSKILNYNVRTIFLFLSLLFGIPTHIFAQAHPSLDSLKFELTKAKNALDSASICNKIVWNNTNLDTNLTYQYAMKSLQLAGRIKNKEKLAEIYDAAAWGYSVKGDLVRAKEYFNKSLTIGNNYKYLERIAWAHYNLGHLAFRESRTDEAFRHALSGRAAFRQLNNITMVIYSDWLILKTKKNYKTTYVDSTISDYKFAISITSDPNILLDEYFNIIYLYGQQENKSQSMFYAMKALDVAEEIKNEKAIYKAYYQIADYLRDYQHNYEVALLYYRRILDIIKKKDNGPGITGTLDDIGITYKMMGNDSLALVFFDESLELGKKINHRHSIANAYKNIGEISYLNKNYDDALTYYKKCYDTGCDVCPKIAFHQVLVDIGKVYLNRNDFPNALKYFNHSLSLADSANARYEKAVSYTALGDYNLQVHNNSSAVKFYLEALKTASSINSLTLRKEITSKLSTAYKEQSNFAKAFEYLSLSNVLSDSLNKLNEAENLSRLETKFEFQNLKQQKENELKESQSHANAEIDRQSQLKYFFIIGFVIAASFGIVIYMSLRRKKKDNEILELQKKQIGEMSEKVHEADQKKLNFFTNISHELRTPLTLILSPIEKLLKEKPGNSGEASLLGMVHRNTLHLFNLINQLLDIRKLDTGNVNLKISQGDILSYCKGIYSKFCHLAEENKITYSIDVPDEEISGWFDKDIVEKALNNLISNAFKYTSKGGEINVKLSAVSGTEKEIKLIRIIVSDNGKGIPEDQVKYVFDRFYQVENTNTGFNTGTGIGLAYTKELIELHKGEISVESRMGYGTTFSITLPVHESCFSITDKSINSDGINEPCTDDIRQKYLEQIIALEREDTPLPDDSESSGERNVMLIVEDNSDMRKFIKNIFENDFVIIESPDGINGFQMASEFVPDIIISDIMMPGMNGLELCNKLKNDIRTNHIPVIILTAKAGEENEIEGLRTGADDYLIKPFNSEILEMRVGRLIETKERLREYFTKEFLLKPKEVTLASPEDEFLRKAVKVVEDNISSPDLNVEMLMKELGVSRTQLFRKLKAITNYSANQFIRNIRLKRAAQLLQHRTYNITEVLYLSGFNSPSYFTSCFKEMYGCLPKEYHSKAENPSVLIN